MNKELIEKAMAMLKDGAGYVTAQGADALQQYIMIQVVNSGVNLFLGIVTLVVGALLLKFAIKNQKFAGDRYEQQAHKEEHDVKRAVAAALGLLMLIGSAVTIPNNAQAMIGGLVAPKGFLMDQVVKHNK